MPLTSDSASPSCSLRILSSVADAGGLLAYKLFSSLLYEVSFGPSPSPSSSLLLPAGACCFGLSSSDLCADEKESR